MGVSALAFAPLPVRASTNALITTPPPDLMDGFTDMSDRLLLETKIDGKGPYRFVVDTGSDVSVIASDVAVDLGLLPRSDVVVEGIVRALPAPTVHLPNLSFGSIAMKDVQVPVLPREWLGADGYLGLDALDGRLVTFDFRNNKLSVDHSNTPMGWTHFNDVVVRVNGSNGRLKAVDCRVNGVRAVAFIDSGAQLSICNTPLYAELQKKSLHAIEGVDVPLLGATGGMMLGKLVEVSRIRLGDLFFMKTRLVIADLNVFNVWGLADTPALFIGMDFLQQASMFSIDYRRKELRFKLADYMSQKTGPERFAKA
jgi:predicted aspartyl protease